MTIPVTQEISGGATGKEEEDDDPVLEDEDPVVDDGDDGDDPVLEDKEDAMSITSNYSYDGGVLYTG